LLASHALVKPAGPPADQAVALQALIILHMLGELAERVGTSRALCAAKEGHGQGKGSKAPGSELVRKCGQEEKRGRQGRRKRAARKKAKAIVQGKKM
jgi:hypothetical protein